MQTLTIKIDDDYVEKITNFLKKFEIINLSKSIISQALENRKIKKIKMADNFIISTAQIFDLNLVTRNVKDFSSFSQKIYNPFETQ